jgi:AcrR family transcriptional regulator
MVRHALDQRDKNARRAAIIGAAHALFVAGDGSLPSAAAIAGAAGLAKGTVYLYFRTKEEIFIALLLEELQALLAATRETLQSATGDVASRVRAFLQAYLGCLRQHPEVLRLDAIGYGVLEKNLDQAKLWEFKAAFVEHLTETASVMEQALGLESGRGTTLLMRTFALTRGLWQSSTPDVPPVEDQRYAALSSDFYGELTEALAEYWHGAVPQSGGRAHLSHARHARPA